MSAENLGERLAGMVSSTSRLVMPPLWRISKTGTAGERNDAVVATGRSRTCVTLNGITVGEWLWITAMTSGRAR